MGKKFIYSLIFIVSVFALFPLLYKSNICGHDTNFHLANIKDISNSIYITNPFPKISTTIGYNLGYGTHLFYAPLPHYIGGYIHLLLRNIGFSADNTLAFVYLLVSFLSGIAVYHLSLEISKNKYTSLISAIIYLLMPYRMADMIVRSSMNELFIFLFTPIILLSLIRLLNKKSFSLLFIIGYTGLILSHLVMTLYTTIFIILWAIFFYKDIFKKENLKKIIKNIIIVSILVLPFIALVFSQKYYSNYLVFADNFISNVNWMKEYGLNFKDFIIQLEDYSWKIPHFINIFVLISFIISCITIFKDKEMKHNKNYIYFISLVIICMFMCLKIFPWKILPKTLYVIQFPWRLQTYITLGISMIAPIYLIKIKKYYYKNIMIVSLAVLLLSTIPLIKSMMTYRYLLDDEINYNYGMGNMAEYLPIKAFDMNEYNTIDYIAYHDSNIKCKDCISSITKNTNKLMKFTISNDEAEQIELPRFNYNGYILKDKNNNKIDFYENEYGLIEFISKAGTNNYTLTYRGPIMYIIFSYIRTISLIILIGCSIIKLKKKIYS